MVQGSGDLVTGGWTIMLNKISNYAKNAAQKQLLTYWPKYRHVAEKNWRMSNLTTFNILKIELILTTCKFRVQMGLNCLY